MANLFFTKNHVVFEFTTTDIYSVTVSVYTSFSPANSLISSDLRSISVSLNLSPYRISGNISYYRLDISDLFQDMDGYFSASISISVSSGSWQMYLASDEDIIMGGGVSKNKWFGPDIAALVYYNVSDRLLIGRKQVGLYQNYPLYRFYLSELKYSGLYMLYDIRSISLNKGPLHYYFNRIHPYGHLFFADLSDITEVGMYSLVPYQQQTSLYIEVVSDPVAEQSHLIRYINSYGVMECLLVTGEVIYVPEFTDAEASLQMDMYGQLRNIPSTSTMREKLTIQTGYQTQDRQLMFRDMLTSKWVWIDYDGETRRCKITCEGYEKQLTQTKPFNLTLNVDFMDDDTCVL